MHEQERLDYLSKQAKALFQQGDEFGDKAVLLAAVQVWLALDTQCLHDRVPLEWV
jgi:hypothetical protein